MVRNNSLVEINDKSFHHVIEQNARVVVDFWASWCGPCRAMSPIFERLSGKFDGKVVFAKMNVDANPEVPAKLNVVAIPTFVVFKNGREEARIVGAAPEETFEKFIRKALPDHF